MTRRMERGRPASLGSSATSGSTGRKGSVIVKVVPAPGALSTSMGHRVHGVEDEVDQHLAQLRGVAVDGGSGATFVSTRIVAPCCWAASFQRGRENSTTVWTIAARSIASSVLARLTPEKVWSRFTIVAMSRCILIDQRRIIGEHRLFGCSAGAAAPFRRAAPVI